VGAKPPDPHIGSRSRAHHDGPPQLLTRGCAPVINDYLVAVAKDVPVFNSDKLSDLRAHLTINVPDCFVVSEISVFNALKHLSVNKSAGSDLFNNRFLIFIAEVLAGPICAIINSSVRQGFVPHQWKISRVTPIPKSFPRSIESDLRPISITSSISKVAESIVSRFFNQHFNPLLDSNQFGCSKDRSTTHALIKICHVIFEGSDQSDNFNRVLFIDFTKAFDVINHNVLHNKLVEYKFPPHLVTWSQSFLEKRLQYVSIGCHVSDVRELNAGARQGTIACIASCIAL
jgi:hypothetical protein